MLVNAALLIAIFMVLEMGISFVFCSILQSKWNQVKTNAETKKTTIVSMGATYSQIQEEMRDLNVWLDNIERRVQSIRKEDLKVRTGGGSINSDAMC